MYNGERFIQKVKKKKEKAKNQTKRIKFALESSTCRALVTMATEEYGCWKRYRSSRLLVRRYHVSLKKFQTEDYSRSI